MLETVHHDVTLADGSLLRVDVRSPHLFRVRLDAAGAVHEGALERYGILRRDWPPVEVSVRRRRGEVEFRTMAAVLRVRCDDGRLRLSTAAGRELVSTAEPPRSRWQEGFRVALALRPGERLYGGGDADRERIQRRGSAGRMAVRNVASYAPIPFFMSTGGWAAFVNTTWFHRFDAGAADPERLVFSAERGGLDLFLIAGESLPELLNHYTALTGRPRLLPLAGYGLTFVCDERGVRARDVLYEAYEFRRHGIPCDTIGLEPGWMEHRYDYSVDKDWSQERFHIPTWLAQSKHSTFCAGLANMGFRLSLWLCCNYDLSEYEERLLGHEWKPLDAADLRAAPGDLVQDPHLQPTYSDRITRTGVPWFEHLKRFVDDGASAFKLDGANQVLFHPDRLWRNGMTDAEMHNLYPLLLGKQMALGFEAHTGRRAMISSAGGYAGIQQYAATWAGDTGGNAGPLVSMLNHGLSGHSNTSCDMEVFSPAGIHFGFLQPWSQVLSWHMYNQPWFQGRDLLAMFTFYARLRYRLLPYLYSAAHVAYRTGLPILRAMPLAAPDDPACADCTRQYLLGDALLTGAFTESLYLPAGRWIDFWTGAVHEGPATIPLQHPPDRGGMLLVRSGAIIPMGPAVDYTGDRPAEEITLDVYPDGDSRTTLYEDDGVSLDYQAGRVAETAIACRATARSVRLAVSPRRGEYDGMPSRRCYRIELHLESAPRAVKVNGQAVAIAFDAARRVCVVRAAEDPARQTPLEVVIRR
ncbi:MAG: DUF5110 domain-containing protein [Lentisphaerae bacterium]|nr:DUF5110 domain-containing protein [Lentisphaerota bacterium]